MKLTRQVAFSSGHRYWLADLSEAENKALFGSWASPYNHGHNYVLEVTVSGRVDERHGMVVNIKDIDAVLKERVVSRYDQKSLNDEVPEFAGRSTSSEFIALAIPLKKLHPRFKDEEEQDEDLSTGKIVYSSEAEGDENKNENEGDPRWNILKKLK